MYQGFVVAATLAALILTGAACSPSAQESEASSGTTAAASPNGRTVRVETVTIQPTEFTDIVELTGSVEAKDDATISSQTAGTIRSLLPLGTRVARGEVVARIDPGLTDAAVEQAKALVSAAEARYRLAKDTFDRQEPLFRDSVISALEFESVRTQLNQSEAELEQAKALLSQASERAGFTRITAPFPGRIEQHFVETGEQVVPGVPVIRVVNTSRVKVATGVPERYATDVREGTSVKIRFNSYGLETAEGSVSFAGSVIDRASRTFPIEVELDNRNGRLKPEMIAKVLVTRERLTDVIVVPLPSIIRDENGTNVFIAAPSQGRKIAQRRSVEVGPTYSGLAVITSGLESGDELVTAGQTLLTPGDALEVIGEEGARAAVTGPPGTIQPATLR